MNDLVDNLRAGLAGLADEARPVDLHDRVLRSSHRLGRQRTLAGSGAGVGAVAAVTVITLAVAPLPDDAPVPPGGPGGSSAPPTVAPAPSEAPTDSPDLPAEAMLQPADLGPGSRVRSYKVVVGSEVGSTGNLTYLTASCGESVGPYAGDGQPESWASVQLLFGDLFVGKQEMFRSKSGGAEQFMADLRVALPKCESVNHFWTEFEQVTSDLTLVRSDFAGAESLLVEQILTSQDGTQTRYHAVVRQGDLITQIWLEEGVDEPRALEIAMAAAQRLCVATDC